MASQQQPFWSESDQRWLSVTFDTKYQRSYSKYWDVTSNQWAFFRWVGPESTSGPTEYHREEGPRVHGTCNPSNPIHGTHYERLDPSYYVRHKDFFQAGKVFSVLFAQSAGDTAMTNYNHDAITTGRYGETVHAQIRRFIVVQQKREFCFAVPIFTYGNRGTTKSGVVPSEHAIAYSYGHQPTLLPGEEELQKDPICIVSTDSVPLSISSRIYFGIHHPIQYNVKVKELGYVLPDDLIKLTSYWAMEHMKLEDEENDVYKERDTGVFTQTQNSALTYYQHEDTKSNNHFEPVKNPRAFFKKGRVSSLHNGDLNSPQ
ncbi:hypothetical protein P3342_007091 [Pyrenophora teres f. teres]|nr:hypothetical protein P3342_007091 [Pyrenophora teres f. teres]